MGSLVDQPANRIDTLTIEREAVIKTLKPKLIATLADMISHEGDREDFLVLCTRVEATVRAWYARQSEEMLQLYILFNPVHGKATLEHQGFSPAQVDKLEQRFLQTLFQMLEKSNFKMLSREEYELATTGKYLLDIPITVDTTKLDQRLFSRYFEKNPLENRPPNSEQFLVFRRGVGLDKTSDKFISEKIDMVLSRLWVRILVFLKIRKARPPPKQEMLQFKKLTDDPAEDDQTLKIERIRLENMDITFKNLFSTNTIQEPTFDRIIVIYRPATPAESRSDLKERSIYIKHYHDIPMADCEIVLPEKKMPGLTPQDWIKFILTAVLGMVALWGSVEKELSLSVLFAVLVALGGYYSRVYFAWQQSIAKYQMLIQKSMDKKQLDSGMGTLLHLENDVLQQEVKEVILSYFVLMSQGRADKKTLDQRCELLMQEEFKEVLDFEVDDAVSKLLKLGIVKKDVNGFLTHQPLKKANDIIGVTTDELVGSLNL